MNTRALPKGQGDTKVTDAFLSVQLGTAHKTGSRSRIDSAPYDATNYL